MIKLEADANYLRLENLVPLAALAPQSAWRDRLSQLLPEGEIRALKLNYAAGDSVPPLYQATAHFAELGFAPVGNGPGLRGLRGEMTTTETAGRASVDSQALVLSMPLKFRAPLSADTARGDVHWEHSAEGWRISTRGFAVRNAHAREAVRQALVNLEAVSAPAGTMPVVLGPGWPGVLLHEAIGHGLEGDFNRKGTSAFTNRIGQRVASELCTVVDDGTLAARRGSLNIDDEGTPTRCTTLIEKGVLRGYLQDKLNARLMGMQPTGNGRRESFAHVVMPRMTNTYMLAGPHDPDEIIRSVKKGLYAVNFGGGQVDITSGKFVFSASEAYLIENGKVTAPVKGATLIGNGPDVLTRVSMVGNDLELDEGVGVCGKEGQSVPVGVGQPTLKVDALTVGGTN